MTDTASVAVNRPFPHPLTYTVPDDLEPGLQRGDLVRVPLGREEVIGCVLGPGEPPPKGKPVRLRAVLGRASPSYRMDEELIALAEWIAEYYCCGVGEALCSVSHIGFADVDLGRRSVYTVAGDREPAGLTERQRAVAVALVERGDPAPRSLTDWARLGGTTPGLLRKLVEAGVLLPALPREDDAALPSGREEPLPLLPGQREALDGIAPAACDPRFAVFLLHGVTGSGKTEVYLQLLAMVLERGGTGLCLVPEISLTPQTIDRFARRFGEPIGVLHSQQTRRAKLVLYERVRRGEIRLVVGARSAVYTPLPRLGIIVVDEEHESSYKNGETPRYHARDVAIMRARSLGIPVVLGSATPSFDSYQNALAGKYAMLRLKERPAGLRLPEVRVVGLQPKAAIDPSGFHLLSPDLVSALGDRLKKGEQSLLFLNRRGFSNFLMCPQCRWVARCEEDDLVLTIHRRRGRASDESTPDLFEEPLRADEAVLRCHFCSRSHPYPAACPSCGATDLMAMGSGTQRIEEALRRTFPEARLLRLDQDSVGGRQGFLRAWNQMVRGEADIILGTQMIAKGLHLERVTLVGVILAEVGLFLSDFRAEERTFALLMQVAGRAGRANMGEVLFQTYMPHQPAIQFASRHDYEGYFEAEISRRRKARFPPVERLVSLTISDRDPGRAGGEARNLAGILRRLSHSDAFQGVRVLGPNAAPIGRLAGRVRMRVLLAGARQPVNTGLLRAALADANWRPHSTSQLTIDVDPQDLL